MPLNAGNRNRTNAPGAVTCPDGAATDVATVAGAGRAVVMFTAWIDNTAGVDVNVTAGITGATPVPALTPDITGPVLIPAGDTQAIRGHWVYDLDGTIVLEVTVAGAELDVEATLTVIPVARV